MPREGTVFSNNERVFILSALQEDQRIDGRRPFDLRPLRIHFLGGGGPVEVQLGQTRVLAVVGAELGPPWPDRPNEGSLQVYTEFSPMADPSFEAGKPGEAAVELGRIVDRGLRESRAVDTEALCVVAGRAVWAVRLDLHILDNGGNMVDAANIAALVALLAFRRPECSVGGGDGTEVIVHPPEERDPVPLTIHHLPVAVTFAFFEEGDLVVLDPVWKEEAAMGGRMTITVNAHGEICAIQKGGGVGITADQVLRCTRIATAKALAVTEEIRKAVEAHEIERQQKKVKRHAPTVAAADLVLTGADLHPQANLGSEETQQTATEMIIEERGVVEELEEDEIVEEEESEEEETEERVVTASAVLKQKKAGLAIGEKERGLLLGGASTWLEADGVSGPRQQGGKRDWRKERPAPKGGPSTEALDEFDQVAALLVHKSPLTNPHKTPGTKPAPETDFALGSDEEEEARVELRGEFSGGSENRIEGAPSRVTEARENKGGVGKETSRMEVDDDDLTLEAAVKPRIRRKKKKLKVQGDD